MTTSALHPVRTALLWAPLLVVLALVAISAFTGVAPRVTGAGAAANIVQVTGQVQSTVYLDASACSSSSSLDIGDIVPNDPWKRTTSDCSILFGTSSSPLGADLTVLEDPAAPASPPGAMKCVVTQCMSSDRQLDDAAPNSPAPTGSASNFGAQLQGAGGAAAGVWSVGSVNPVAGATTACQTAAAGDGTCSFRFGASADVNDGSGAYQAQVQFVALAR